MQLAEEHLIVMAERQDEFDFCVGSSNFYK